MMKHLIGLGLLAAALCGLALATERGSARAGELVVVSTTPAARSLSAPILPWITVTFDRPVSRASFVPRRSFWAFGRWSGAVDGEFQFSDGDRTVALVPDRRLSAGEQVMVILSHDIESADGDALRTGGYSFHFWTAARQAPREWEQIDSMTARTNPPQSVRVYGGFATDLNRDGYLDITAVNEDSADLRVFLNKADRSGLFHEFAQPPYPVNNRASPSEPTDFNADGFADVCVANINTNTVSILLGAGDGSFNPQQEVVVGLAPRGIAVLDVDGDGDVDIVNTNADSSNLSLMLNDGTGVMGSPIFFEGGGAAEWALAAEDMNNDGLLDLVVGARSSQLIIVHTARGDGRFTQQPAQSSGGNTWMLACGDLNGDGNADVSCANSSQNSGSILLGNGDGTLAPPTGYASSPFPLATDLGDLDGDGDLDWVTSSFLGDWWLYLNDGSGDFTHAQTFPAPQAASDSLLLDIDNDGDLDLALMDELADVIILMKNSGTGPCLGLGDLNTDGRRDGLDIQLFVVALSQGGAWTPDQLCAGDFTNDGSIGEEDIGPFVQCLLGLSGCP